MAKKDIFSDMGLTNMSHLLDPSLIELEPMPQAGASQIATMKITKLRNFKNHPFRVDTECEDFLQLLDSVKEYGILYPLLIRPMGENFEIVAGHRRKTAALMAGYDEVPVIIRVMDDYEATIVMVHTNLQREHISYSEKAKAYRMCVEAERHQGKEGSDTAALVGEGHDSRRQVYRYVRLSYLLDELLEWVDNRKIPFNTGVEMAYLDEDSQHNLLVYIEQTGKCPTIEQVKKLRALYEKEKMPLTYEKIVAELAEVHKQKASNKVSFKTKELVNYFDEGTDVEEMASVILMLLSKYRNGEFDELIKE